jgi:predicted nucleotidyltransferase component of viral defense system
LDLLETYQILSGLVNLRPGILQKLLEGCNSIKVKRLFLYMSNKANHQWAQFLELSTVDLRQGERSIVKNGVYDPKYRISVPPRISSVMIDPKYKAQVDLLLQTIPYVAKETIFALKGGTAINLFLRNMPRLSLDIDLTYLPIDDRDTALRSISDGLGRIKADLEKLIRGINVTPTSREGQDAKINCQIRGAQIKIEVNTVTRGIINQPSLRRVQKVVEDTFGKFASINVVSMAELYGGKICAAMDRQHPRNLFDVKLLLDNEGITEDIKIGFIIALHSHMRPIIGGC